MTNLIVRFPNSLRCELGERMPWERGIFLPWQIVAKIFIESGQLRTELAFSTRDLALSHWPTSHKCTGCGCRAAFLSTTSLGKFRHQFGKVPPPIWESSATNLGFSLNCISQLDFFHICFIFVFIRSLAAFTIRHAVVLRQKNDQTSIQNFIADCGTKF